MTSLALDRRQALKSRHRDAILAAARALITERDGPSFTVDELAARADVARRTVFNHFAGLDDVLLTVCTDVLAVLVEGFLAGVARVPVGDGSRTAMFDELAEALRASDLPGAIVQVLRTLGGAAASEARRVDLSEAAFTRVGGRLLAEVGRRNPAADALDAELLVNALMHGVAVVAQHWIDRTDGRLDPTARAQWSDLLDRLLDRTRTGYAPG